MRHPHDQVRDSQLADIRSHRAFGALPGQTESELTVMPLQVAAPGRGTTPIMMGHRLRPSHGRAAPPADGHRRRRAADSVGASHGAAAAALAPPGRARVRAKA